MVIYLHFTVFLLSIYLYSDLFTFYCISVIQRIMRRHRYVADPLGGRCCLGRAAPFTFRSIHVGGGLGLRRGGRSRPATGAADGAGTADAAGAADAAGVADAAGAADEAGAAHAIYAQYAIYA